jgi:hemoglobin
LTLSPDPNPYALLGGRAAVLSLTEVFYDHMEATEPALTAVHEQDTPGKIARRSRDRFGMFLVGWLGGPQDYIAQHGHPRLRMRHQHVRVGVELRDAWLRCMCAAMDQRAIVGEVRVFLDQRFADVADFMRNEPADR